MATLNFNENQKNELKTLGVLDAQIVELEKVLPTCRAWTADAPPMQDVLDELMDFSKAINGAHDSIVKMSQAGKTIPARFEAQQRIEVAYSDIAIPLGGYDGADQLLKRAQEALIAVQEVVANALQNLPRTQRRSYAANTRAIEWIDNALTLTFANQHYPVSSGEYDPADTSALQMPTPPPPYPFPVSSGVTRPFRIIAGICYQVITGKPDVDPERAIKTYLKQRKTRDEKQRAAMNISMDSAARTAGGKKSKLPSVT